MIYATIDVDLRDHERAMSAGLAAMGLWTWAMLYARGQKRGGELSRVVVLRCPWGDADQLERAAARLVDVGLWQTTETGWLIGNYEAKNQTPAEIERSIQGARDRKRVSRDRQSSSSLAVTTARPALVPVPTEDRAVTEMSRVTPSDVSRVTAGSGSRYGSDVCLEGVQGEPPEPVREPERPSGIRPIADTASATPPPDDIPITPGLEAACVMAGAPKPTREHIQTMLAKARLKRRSSLDWPGEVVLWMLRQQQFDRDRPRAGPLVQAVPATGRLWKVGL